MANITDYTNLTAITRTKILPGIEDQIMVDMPLFRRLWGNSKKLDGGLSIEKVIEYALSTQGGAYTGLII